jgi:hypothetical protein
MSNFKHAEAVTNKAGLTGRIAGVEVDGRVRVHWDGWAFSAWVNTSQITHDANSGLTRWIAARDKAEAI